MAANVLEGLKATAEKQKVTDILVKNFMTQDVITITTDTRIYFAVKTLGTHRISGAPVVDSRGNIVGVVSEYDLLMQASTQDLASPINYSKKPITLKPDDKLMSAIVLFYSKKIRRLPVVDLTNKVVGIVSIIDALKVLTEPQKRPDQKPNQ